LVNENPAPILRNRRDRNFQAWRTCKGPRRLSFFSVADPAGVSAQDDSAAACLRWEAAAPADRAGHRSPAEPVELPDDWERGADWAGHPAVLDSADLDWADLDWVALDLAAPVESKAGLGWADSVRAVQALACLGTVSLVSDLADRAPVDRGLAFLGWAYLGSDALDSVVLDLDDLDLGDQDLADRGWAFPAWVFPFQAEADGSQDGCRNLAAEAGTQAEAAGSGLGSVSSMRAGRAIGADASSIPSDSNPRDDWQPAQRRC
jgi:hypothetical protein